MQEVLDSFEERANEVMLYFEHLEKFYDPNVYLAKDNDDGTTERLPMDSDFLKILKANAFLITYNLVESSITDGVLAIYKELEVRSYTFEKVREELREIWINYHYQTVFDHSSNFQSYRKQAKRLVEMAINRTTIKLDKKAIGISGNLDADIIREICYKHGINSQVDPICRGGEKLGIVKEQRNALAHGNLSFSECGRSFTDTGLREIMEQVILYVRNILVNMKEYLEQQKYDISNLAN